MVLISVKTFEASRIGPKIMIMCRQVLLSIVFIFLSDLPRVQAESIVSKISVHNAKAFNHLYYGFADCEAITQKRVRSLISKSVCLASDPDPLNESAGFDILKQTVFDSASTLYLQKHQCLKDYTESVVQDERLVDEFRNRLIPLYINQKKAKLVLLECGKMTAALAGMALQKGSSAKEKLKNIPGIKFDLVDQCQNPGTVAALQALIEMSSSALPFMSSKRPFEIVDEKYRHVLLSSKTNQPLTDDEILKLDLKSATEQFYFKRTDTAPLKADLVKFFRSKVSDRQHFADELRKGPSEENLRELFNEGSAVQALENLGLSEENSQQDATLREMRYCLKSTYESNAFAEAYNFMLTFLIAKKVIPNGMKAKAAEANKSWLVDMAASLPASAPNLFKSCSMNAIKRVRIADPKTDKPKNFDLDLLPSGFNFYKTDFSKRKMQSIRSCQTPELEKLILKSEEQLSCAAEAMAGIFPPIISLPAALFGPE